MAETVVWSQVIYHSPSPSSPPPCFHFGDSCSGEAAASKVLLWEPGQKACEPSLAKYVISNEKLNLIQRISDIRVTRGKG